MPEAKGPEQLLAQMLVTVINAREQEGNRVSRVLHDEVGQVLSAVGLQLDVLRMDFRDIAPQIVERTAEIQSILETAVERVRNLSYELNPAIVDRAGLPAAMDRLMGRFRDSFPGSLRLLYDSSVRIPAAAANAFYKIAEHAIGNAVRHAACTQIEVLIRPNQKLPALEVRDNGTGFDVAEVRSRFSGLGLLLMDCYASQAGLDFTVRSSPGKGTIVKATFRTGDGGA